MAGTSSVSGLLYLVAILSVLQHVPKVFSRAFKADCLWSRDMCMLQVVVASYRRQKSLTR